MSVSALVLWDPARAAAALAALTIGRNPVLSIGQQQLANFVHNDLGREVLALPGRDVEFVRGRITHLQIGSHRPSYVNAILIQSRGRRGVHSCKACRDALPGPRPFPECRRLPGHFSGACANYKWRDYAGRCSVRDAGKENDGRPDNSSDDSDMQVTGVRRLGPAPGGNAGSEAVRAAGTAQNPVVI